MKKILSTILVIISIYPLGYYLMSWLLYEVVPFDNFLHTLLSIVWLIYILLSIVWLLGNCLGLIKFRLPSNLKELIYLIKKSLPILFATALIIVGIYPLGYYLMSWLLYDLSESSPLIALIGLIIYPIVYILYLVFWRIKYGQPISSEDARAWGSAVQKTLKICPHCLKKLPSVFTTKCPHCTADL